MFLLADIGRTKIRLAVSSDGRTFDEPLIKPTPPDFVASLTLIKEFIGQAGPEKITAVCLGKSRKVWPGAPLEVEVQKIVQGPLFLENDTALVGLGEVYHGAGRNGRLVVYITVSTGVGGVLIVNGRIAENVFGFEPGLQTLVADGEPCLLEDLVSGAALTKRFGRPPAEIRDEKIWQDLSHYLAIGLVNSLLHWSPDCLVLGGSMFKSPGFQIALVQKLLAERLALVSAPAAIPPPVVRQAALGDLGGLWGALAYLNHSRPS